MAHQALFWFSEALELFDISSILHRYKKCLTLLLLER
jgi:hypothetical protein